MIMDGIQLTLQTFVQFKFDLHEYQKGYNFTPHFTPPTRPSV